MDQNLTMEGFVKVLTRMVGLRLYKFSKIRYLLSTRVSKVVYRHTIAPLFDYCGFLVDGLTCQAAETSEPSIVYLCWWITR